MTEQEAMEIIMQIAYDGEFPNNSNEAFGIACRCLEKQIPKKPIKKHREHGGDTLLCPTCNDDIYTDTGDSYVDYPLNYCDSCGQKIQLDWSE